MYENPNTSYSIGKKLKSVREGKKINLEEVSSNLKIGQQFLEAIEVGNYEMIPGEVYLRGFVKNYSEYLGLDSTRALKVLKREREYARKIKQSLRVKKEKQLPDTNLKFTPGKLFWFIFVLVLAIFGILMLIRAFVAIQRPKLFLTFPMEAEASYTQTYKIDTSSEKIKLKGEINAGNGLYLNDKVIETFGLGEFETPDIELREGENNFEIKTRNQFGIENMIVISIFKNTNED